jgi:steroid delta-isomerase-like uncharacterized protein
LLGWNHVRKEDNPVSTQENKATFRRYVEEGWAKGNVEVADEVFAEGYVAHQPDGSEEKRGPEDVKQFLRQYREAFPELQITLEDQIAEDDKVVTRWASRGTYRGEFRGIAPTGNEVSLTGMGIFRFSEGKVVESWDNFDQLGMLRQLGAISSPE